MERATAAEVSGGEGAAETAIALSFLVFLKLGLSWLLLELVPPQSLAVAQLIVWAFGLYPASCLAYFESETVHGIRYTYVCVKFHTIIHTTARFGTGGFSPILKSFLDSVGGANHFDSYAALPFQTEKINEIAAGPTLPSRRIR
jgi:hypothetical protein